VSQLETKIAIDGGVANITLIGQINEDSQFETILAVGENKIVFNFDQVDSINSCGIRDWIKMLGELGDKEVTYKNCRQIIIEQMNMVHGFIKEGATVESFYAPYFCENCEHEMQHLLKTNEVSGGEAPDIKCPECGHEHMDFDAIADQYFQFLNQIKG
jgi:DNA-directed RNA polymerase subunit RPC12/RpoP